MNENIITIQSMVAGGYVGNNIASLAIQLHGIDTVQIPTTILSNHVEYLEVFGNSTDPQLFNDLLNGIINNKFVEKSAFLISGYCDDNTIISAISHFIKQTKNVAGYHYIYDPVMGDFRSGGLYIAESTAQHSISMLLPYADIVTPNHFELEYILQASFKTIHELEKKAAEHPVLSYKTIIATGVKLNDTPENKLEIILLNNGKCKRFITDLIPVDVIGSGDLFTAVFTAQYYRYNNLDTAINIAITYLNAVILFLYKKRWKEFNAHALSNFSFLLK